MRFVDANIFIRYLTQDDRAKAAASYALFQQVRGRHEVLLTSEATIAEVTYVLSSAKHYSLTHADIAALLRPVLRLRGLKLPYKRTVMRALDLYETYPRLDFEDALAVAYMNRAGLGEIVSYDRDFDGVPGVRRDEP